LLTSDFWLLASNFCLLISRQAQLPARPHHITPARDADEGRHAAFAKNLLKSQDAFERRSAVGQVGAGVVRDKIDFGANPFDELSHAASAVVGGVNAGEQHVFKGEPLARREPICPSSLAQSAPRIF